MKKYSLDSKICEYKEINLCFLKLTRDCLLITIIVIKEMNTITEYKKKIYHKQIMHETNSDLNPIEWRRCFMDVSYKKQSLTFIGYHTFIDPQKGYEECPAFWEQGYRQRFAHLYNTMTPENALEQAMLDNHIGAYGIILHHQLTNVRFGCPF